MSGPMCKENYVFSVKYISSHYRNDNYTAGIKSMYMNDIHIYSAFYLISNIYYAIIYLTF